MALKQESGDSFWADNISVLLQSDRMSEFFPTSSQTSNERLNSIMRFGMYVSVLLALYNRETQYLLIFFVFGAITLFVHKNSKAAVEGLEDTPATQKTCTQPTIDNPFMNATMGDYMNIVDGKIVDRPPACDATSDEVKEQVENAFENNLYRDVTDVFGKFNSQRQFYTMPSTTIPNDRDSYMKWLYATPKTCKEDNECLRYEDVRANRPVVSRSS
jgi:hypothetical protein